MIAPKQLLLGIAPPRTAGFDNFVVGDNREAVERVHDLANSRAPGAICLWGAEGVGKSHLLSAARHDAERRRPVVVVSADHTPGRDELRGGSLVIADDVEKLDDARQQWLFRLFNAARLTGTSLLLATCAPPATLELRDDLRTRLGQCLVLGLTPLAEAERRAALHRHAAQRGMRLDDGLIDYLLRHGRRDLPTLMATLDALDRTSLEQKRQPTVPLLREVMTAQAPAESRP